MKTQKYSSLPRFASRGKTILIAAITASLVGVLTLIVFMR